MTSQRSHSTPALLKSPPTGRPKWLVDVAIAAFLATQVAIPASYYVGNEPTSERFSWRMFSSIDLSQWTCVFKERIDMRGQQVERVIPLEDKLQETTRRSIRAVQLDIVTKFMRKWCERPEVQAVLFEARGTAPGGRPLGPVRLIIERADGIVRRVEP